MDHESASQTHAVERYLHGEMPLEERDSFEEHYFACAVCADDIRLASAMSRDMKAVLGDGLPARNRFAWFRIPVLVPSCAALALLVLAGYQNLVVFPELRAPRSVGPAFVLDGQTRSGVPQLAAGDRLHFQTSLDGLTGADRLFVELDNGAGQRQASGEVPAPAPHQPLDVYFPGGVDPGRYVLVVREAAGRKEVSRSSFEVVPKPAAAADPAAPALPQQPKETPKQ